MGKSLRVKAAALVAALKSKRTAAVAGVTVAGVPLLTPGVALAGGYSYSSTQPPDTGKITTILGYLFWGVGLAGVVGLLSISAMMAVAHHNGRGGGEHVGKIGYVAGAMILAGAAGSIVTSLM